MRQRRHSQAKSRRFGARPHGAAAFGDELTPDLGALVQTMVDQGVAVADVIVRLRGEQGPASELLDDCIDSAFSIVCKHLGDNARALAAIHHWHAHYMRELCGPVK
ncbi:MAG: hypothetical protein WEF50_11130 [Myxococcota bacterium]